MVPTDATARAALNAIAAGRSRRRRNRRLLSLFGRQLETDLGEVARERRVDPADALDQGRVGREQAEELTQSSDGVAEEHMARLLGVRILDVGALFQRPDLLEGAGDAIGIAGELDGRGISEELALAGDRSLDQVAEEHAHVADHVEGQADQGKGVETSAVIAVVAGAEADVDTRRAAEDQPAGQSDHENTEENTHEPDVDPHVAVQDVAELVPDDALQLVSRQPPQGARGDRDDGIPGRVAGGEGVDSRLVLEQVDRRDRQAGGDRHLLDHVQEPPLFRVCSVGMQQPAAQ